MAAVDAGMNLAEVETLGATLRQSADDLARYAAMLDKLVKSTVWQGATATKFKTQWWPQHRARLQQIQGDVRGFGQSATNNATQQRRASDADSGGTAVGANTSNASGPTLRAIIKLPMAEQVEAWNALTSAQQHALLQGKEDSIGEFVWVAPEIRYAANRQLVFEQYTALLGQEAHGPLSGSSKLRLELYERLLREHQQVLFFDPSGDGRISVVQGDLTRADHVAIAVPGIGSNLDNFGGLLDEGRRLRGSAGSDSAVVTWLGYDTPVGVGWNGTRMVAEITNSVMSKPGANALVGFVGGLRGINPSADVTVIGHSYGSLVTGLAAKEGLDADKIVFIGSPGVGVDSVNDFNLRDGARVFAAEAAAGVRYQGVGVGGDPVSNIGHNVGPFGGVPTERGFGAEVVDIGGRFNVGTSHSDYFKADSLSLQKLGSIVRAEGDERI